MQRVNLWLSLFFTLTLLVTGVLEPGGSVTDRAAAQTASDPLIILMNGDLWSWSPNAAAPEQLTTWGYVSQPALAPDGDRVAYNAWASVMVDALAQGQPVAGVIPSNIGVLDLATGQTQMIAEQPAGATLDAEGGWQNALMRGKPAWSPDGTRLAWSELYAPDFVYRLVVFDLTTMSETVIVQNLPSPYADAGNIPVHRVQWSTWGISVHTVAVNAESGDFEERLSLYDQSGTLLAEHLIGSSASEFTLLHAWMDFEGTEVIGLLYPSGKQFMLDVSTFVAAMDTVFGGFRARADETYALLQAPGTRFVVVAAPERDALREAGYFVQRLARDRMPLAGLVLNRVAVSRARISADRARDAAEALEESGDRHTAAVLRVHADHAEVAARHRRLIRDTAASYPRLATVQVPLAGADIADLPALRDVGRALTTP